MSAKPKFGSIAVKCVVCDKSVYKMEEILVDNQSLHKTCFKCEHCKRQLTLSNFAAVNAKFYCKAHYIELFKSKGGDYSVFGDAGFKHKSGRFSPVNVPSEAKAATSSLGSATAQQSKPVPAPRDPPAQPAPVAESSESLPQKKKSSDSASGFIQQKMRMLQRNNSSGESSTTSDTPRQVSQEDLSATRSVSIKDRMKQYQQAAKVTTSTSPQMRERKSIEELTQSKAAVPSPGVQSKESSEAAAESSQVVTEVENAAVEAPAPTPQVEEAPTEASDSAPSALSRLRAFEKQSRTADSANTSIDHHVTASAHAERLASAHDDEDDDDDDDGESAYTDSESVKGDAADEAEQTTTEQPNGQQTTPAVDESQPAPSPETTQDDDDDDTSEAGDLSKHSKQTLMDIVQSLREQLQESDQLRHEAEKTAESFQARYKVSESNNAKLQQEVHDLKRELAKEVAKAMEADEWCAKLSKDIESLKMNSLAGKSPAMQLESAEEGATTTQNDTYLSAPESPTGGYVRHNSSISKLDGIDESEDEGDE